MKTVSQSPMAMALRAGRSPRGRTAATVIPLTIVLAGSMTACSGGDNEAAPPAPATARPRPPAATTSTTEDRATARSLVLTKADFPAGWKMARAAGSDLPFGTPAGTAHTYTASVTGHGLQRADQVAVSSARIVRQGEDMAMDAALLRTQSFTKTFKKELGKVITKENPGASRGSVTLKPLKIDYRQYGIAYRASTRIKLRGLRTTLYEDWVWLANRRGEITVSFANVNAPFDTTLRNKLIAKLDARLAAADT